MQPFSPVMIALLSVACGGASAEVHTPPHRDAPASLCHDRAPIAAPPPRTVAGYPLAVPVLSQEEAQARAAAAESADWPQIRIDRYGLIESIGSRKGFRPPGYSEGQSETGERPEDVALVQKFVDAHPALFGPDARDRVAGHGRIGSDYIMRFWGNGVISIQSMHTARFLEMLAAGRTMPAARRAADLLAPWVGAELVKAPMPSAQMPCDPVTPSGRECLHDEPAPPPPVLETFEVHARPPATMLRGEPPVLRSIVEVVLERDQRPCQKLPHLVDAVTGEVIEWTTP